MNEPLVSVADGPNESVGGWCWGLRWLLTNNHHDPNDTDWERWLRCSCLSSWFKINIRDEESIQRFHTAQEGSRLTTFHVSGPALVKVRGASSLLWICALLMPFIGYSSGRCPGMHEPFGHYNGFVVWIICACFLSYAMWKEFEAFRLMILPYCQMFVRPGDGYYFTALGYKLPCSAYVKMIFLVSTISKLDLFVNGLMLSKILITNHCDECKKGAGLLGKIKGIVSCDNNHTLGASMDPFQIWNDILAVTFLNEVGFIHNLTRAMTIAWAIMFIQLVQLILQAYPGERRRIDYGWAAEARGYRTIWQAVCARVRDREMPLARHADCLKVMAFNSRMDSLTDKSLDWSLMRARERADAGGAEILATECDRLSKKVWLFTALERGLMLEVQTTLFAISHHMLKNPEWGIPWHKQYDGQILFSVVISFFCYLKAVYDNFDQIRKLARCLAEFERYQDLSTTRCPEVLCRAKLDLYFFWMGFVLANLNLVIFAVKFQAVFTCESAFWQFPWATPNVTIWGCVNNNVFNISAEGY